jgi:hypothetical protein
LPPGQFVPAFAPMQLPDAPQYVLFDVGSMQEPPQLIWTPAHVSVHIPPTQSYPVAHDVPAFVPVQSPEAPQN